MRFHNRIYFSNEQHIEKITDVTRELVREAINETLAYEHFSRSAEVSVTFTDDVKIRKLNEKYRGKNRPTDVLSFPMMSGDDSGGDYDPECGCVLLGDIVISVQRARVQADEYGHGLDREIAFLAVHSTLHLLGYDHERSTEEDELMQKKQEDILGAIGLPRDKE